MQEMNGIGKIIKDCREFQGKEITDCSRHLNIPIEYLDAIEKNLLSIMPTEDYASKCIRKYVNYLQITGRELDNIIDEMNLILGISDRGKVDYKELFSKIYNVLKIFFLIILSLISISIILNNDSVHNVYERMFSNFYYDGTSSIDQNKNMINNQSFDNNSMSDISSLKSVDEVSFSNSENLFENKLIQIAAKKDLWVEIKDQNGVVLFQNNFEKGDRYIFIYKDGHVLSTNNAPNLEIKYDNITINTLEIKEIGIVDINLIDIIQ